MSDETMTRRVTSREPHYAAGTAHLAAVLGVVGLLIVLGVLALVAWLIGV